MAGCAGSSGGYQPTAFICLSFCTFPCWLVLGNLGLDRCFPRFFQDKRQQLDAEDATRVCFQGTSLSIFFFECQPNPNAFMCLSFHSVACFRESMTGQRFPSFFPGQTSTGFQVHCFDPRSSSSSSSAGARWRNGAGTP